MIRILMVSILLFFTFVVTAQGEKVKKWSDQAELAFVNTSGNSEATTLAFKNELKYIFSDNINGTWKVRALYAENDGDKTAENYFTELRGNYLFSEKIYAYLAGGWFKDTFSGIDSQIFIGPGAGYKFFTGPKHFLLGEAGVNYTSEEYTDDSEDQFVTGRLYGEYEYAFNEKTKFKQSLEFFSNFEEVDDYQLVSETSVITSLNSIFSLKSGYTVKYDNQPATDSTEDTDTILAVTLIANY
jgi:putative salt-induced outer membrane protein